MRKLDILKLATIAFLTIAIIALIWVVIQPKTSHWSDPASKAGMLIRDLSTQKAAYNLSDEVIFSKGKTISVNAIAMQSKGNLQPENVCILPGDFENHFGRDKQFDGIEGISIIYNGSVNQKTRIGGICDNGKAMTENDYFETYTAGAIKKEWVDVCDCVSTDNDLTCCVIALKTAK